MNKVYSFIILGAILLQTAMPSAVFAQSNVNDQLKKIQDLTTQIKALQDQMNGLKQQQVALQTTAQQTAFEMRQGLGLGTESEQVALLQTLLALDSAIYPEGKVTGYFGPATRKALQRFQKQNGLAQVGSVGPQTRQMLEKLFKTHFAEAKEIEDDIEDDVRESVQQYLATLPVVNDGSCVIPPNPYGTTSPFIQKDGKKKIVSNGNTLVYKNGKHKIVITPNSYTEKNGKKQTLITNGVRIDKDGKNKTIIRCGTGTTTPPVQTGDTTAPVQSSIQTSPAHTSATVTWITNENAISKIYYSSTSPVLMATAFNQVNTTLKTSHSFTLSGLTPSTTYYFHVVSVDAAGNSATSSERTLVTTAAPDTSAPVLSAIGVSAGTSSATVNWFSNEASNSKVYFGTATPLAIATATTQFNASLVTNHSLALTGLTPNTTYYFRVESADAAGNTATSSETSFVTSALPVVDVTAPTLSAIGASNIGSTSATIGWNSNELATTKVYYGLSTPLATSSALSTVLAGTRTTHSLPLVGLTASSTYYVRVESADVANNVATGSEFSFVTAQ